VPLIAAQIAVGEYQYATACVGGRDRARQHRRHDLGVMVALCWGIMRPSVASAVPERAGTPDALAAGTA